MRDKSAYIVPTYNPFLKFIQTFFSLSFSFTKSPHQMGINIREAQRERGSTREINKGNDTTTCASSCLCALEMGAGVSETEKMEERETVCPQDSILEAEVGDLLSRGESSSVLPC